MIGKKVENIIFIFSIMVFIYILQIIVNYSIKQSTHTVLSLKHHEQEVINFYQEKSYSCGAAAMHYLLYNYYGMEVTEDELRSLIGTTQKGSSLLGMAQATEMLGLTSRSSSTNFEYIKKLKKPGIVFLGDNHFVVLKYCSNNEVYIFDPDPQWGHVKIRKEEFLKIWNRVLMLVETRPIQ